MATYLLVTLTIHDVSWVKDYIANVPAILRSHGGEYLAVSRTVKRYEGEGPLPDQIAVFTFPSLAAVDAFMACPEYAPYRAARLAHATADILGFETTV
jgi:uncharacterized protein (DUF1330 family)